MYIRTYVRICTFVCFHPTTYSIYLPFFLPLLSPPSRVSSDVVSGLVTKAFNGKPKVKQAALDICLMYIEIEKHDVVQVCAESCSVCSVTYTANF